MPGLPRKVIRDALVKRLTAVKSMKSVSQRWKPTIKVDKADQPALFLVSGDSDLPRYQEERVPATWPLEPVLFLYARTDDPDVIPSDVLDPLVQDIESALLWQPGDSHPAVGSPTTLGGLVEHCRVAGVFTDEAPIDGQAVVVIKLHILAVSS